MNKALKKYGKEKWLRVRLSRNAKIKHSLNLVNASAIAASCVAQINAIKLSGGSKLEKSIAIAESIINTQSSISYAIGGVSMPAFDASFKRYIPMEY